MIAIAVLLLYLAIFKDAEPYLLIPIAVGMLLVNLDPTLMAAPVKEVGANGVANTTTSFSMRRTPKNTPTIMMQSTESPI